MGRVRGEDSSFSIGIDGAEHHASAGLPREEGLYPALKGDTMRGTETTAPEGRR
jgi:hypothetical protein